MYIELDKFYHYRGNLHKLHKKPVKTIALVEGEPNAMVIEFEGESYIIHKNNLEPEFPV